MGKRAFGQHVEAANDPTVTGTSVIESWPRTSLNSRSFSRVQHRAKRPSAHSITSTAPQLNAARPLLAARPRRVKDCHPLTRRVHFPRSSLSRNSPRCPASAPFSETCFDSSCSHGVPPSPALPPRRLHPSTTAATSARSCRTSVIPTSFEFLTAGSRERERVVFRLSSKYHETWVSPLPPPR